MWIFYGACGTSYDVAEGTPGPLLWAAFGPGRNRWRGFVILTFSGIDCSGKSTQIDLLSGELGTWGWRVKRFWFRPGYSAELDWARKTVRRLRPHSLPTTNQPGARDQAFSKPHVRYAWLALALVDTTVQLASKVRAYSLAGYVVLCDRYVFDALMDLDLRFAEFGAFKGGAATALNLVCPTPTRSFLLHLGRDEMLRRMQIKAEPFPDPPAVRERRFEGYTALAQMPPRSTIVVDAGAEAHRVHQEILSWLPDRLRR